jgi:hypothetical protein
LDPPYSWILQIGSRSDDGSLRLPNRLPRCAPTRFVYAVPTDNSWYSVLYVHTTLFRLLLQSANASRMIHQTYHRAAVPRGDGSTGRRRWPCDSGLSPAGGLPESPGTSIAFHSSGTADVTLRKEKPRRRRQSGAWYRGRRVSAPRWHSPPTPSRSRPRRHRPDRAAARDDIPNERRSAPSIPRPCSHDAVSLGHLSWLVSATRHG